MDFGVRTLQTVFNLSMVKSNRCFWSRSTPGEFDLKMKDDEAFIFCCHFEADFYGYL